MEMRQPQWQLRRICPVCGQAGLVLVACPECSHIAVICAEEGSAFQNVQTIVSESALDAEAVRCPQCGGPLLSVFKPATFDEILNAGVRPIDYE
jgi:hypothetical protein